MKLASQADFEQGGLYTEYRRYPFFAERAANIVAAYGSVKTLVVGCGWGYLVDELVALGVDAWGCDASSYAVNKAKALAGAAFTPNRDGLNNAINALLSLRVLQADATSRSQLATVKSLAGLTGNAKFPLVVTEDLLPMLTIAETNALLTECRRIGANVLHVITPGDPADPAKNPSITWKSIETWKLQVAPDAVMNAERANRIV